MIMSGQLLLRARGLLRRKATHTQLIKRRFSSPVAAAAGSGGDASPYDMVIVGGGMVGSALACSIGENNQSH